MFPSPIAESTGGLVQPSGPSDEILDGTRGEQVPIRIQGIDSEILWTPNDAALAQRLDHLFIATATDIGVARDSSDRLLPLVFVATEQPNEFLLRAVRLGTESNGVYPVLEGLSVGERIVTEGSFMLRAEWLKQHPVR